MKKMRMKSGKEWETVPMSDPNTHAMQVCIPMSEAAKVHTVAKERGTTMSAVAFAAISKKVSKVNPSEKSLEWARGRLASNKIRRNRLAKEYHEVNKSNYGK